MTSKDNQQPREGGRRLRDIPPRQQVVVLGGVRGGGGETHVSVTIVEDERRSEVDRHGQHGRDQVVDKDIQRPGGQISGSELHIDRSIFGPPF